MISVLLPSIRPHLVYRALASVAPAAAGVDYEVVVVADFDDQDASLDSHVRWIVSRREGVIAAIELAYTHATGEYVFVFNDESVLEPGALKRLHDEAEAHPNEVLTPVHLPPYPFIYYGLPFAPFPFVHRHLVQRLGGLFDPAYKGFYADPDFSLRAHDQGIPIRVVKSAILRHSNNHDAPHMHSVHAYAEADRALFRSRWDKLGEFQDP